MIMRHRLKIKCSVCGRRLTRNDLARCRGELKPMYGYIDDDGDIKPLCVTCYHRIIGAQLRRIAREELRHSARSEIIAK